MLFAFSGNSHILPKMSDVFSEMCLIFSEMSFIFSEKSLAFSEMFLIFFDTADASEILLNLLQEIVVLSCVFGVF